MTNINILNIMKTKNQLCIIILVNYCILLLALQHFKNNYLPLRMRHQSTYQYHNDKYDN